MKNIIPKIIGLLQIIGGLTGLILFINDRYFAVIPVLFLISNLIAGILLITKEKIGTPLSFLVLAPQLVHIYSEKVSLFNFSTPISLGVTFQPELTIGIYESHGFTAIYSQGLPNGLEINLLAVAGIIYLWNNYDKKAEPIEWSIPGTTPVD